MLQKSGQATLIIALKSILADNTTLGTQEALCAELQKQGFSLTQSSLSRLLRKLGVIKIVTASGESIYRLPSTTIEINYTPVKHLITSIVPNETVIVIRTNPGSASLIASMLDNKQFPEIIGTIAGDDTILVIPQSIKAMDKTLQAIHKIINM